MGLKKQVRNMWIMKFLWMKGMGFLFGVGWRLIPEWSYAESTGQGWWAPGGMTSFLSHIQTGWIWSVGGGTQMQMGNASAEPALTLWQGSGAAAWQHHMGYSLRTQAHKPSRQHMLNISSFFTESACNVENAAAPFIFSPRCFLSPWLKWFSFS